MSALAASRTPVSGAPPAMLVVPATGTETTVNDARSGAEFETAAYLYIHEDSGYNLEFVTHVPDGSSLPLARNVSLFLNAIWHAANSRVGRLCSRLRARPVDVWLTRVGEPGGEMQSGSIYIYNLAAARTPLEWARELAHEYGHYLLPSATNFSSPEAWANGVLGERLFLHWLYRDSDSGGTSLTGLPFATRTDLAEYEVKQVDPLVDWAESGLDLELLARTDRKGFDAFTGMMLFIDSVYRAPTLFQLLQYLPVDHSPTVSALTFLAAFKQWVQAQSGFQTHMAPHHGTMLYLPAGKLQVTAVPADAGPTGDGLAFTRTATGFTVTVARAGWYAITVQKSADLQWRRN